MFLSEASRVNKVENLAGAWVSLSGNSLGCGHLRHLTQMLWQRSILPFIRVACWCAYSNAVQHQLQPLTALFQKHCHPVPNDAITGSDAADAVMADADLGTADDATGDDTDAAADLDTADDALTELVQSLQYWTYRTL